MSTFDHERLDVYQAALHSLWPQTTSPNKMSRGRALLADQLQRAATSIVLNIAEGAGEFSKKEKARFDRIASRSATESAAILDIFKRLKLASDDTAIDGTELLVRIASMLTRLTSKLRLDGQDERQAQRRERGAGTGTRTPAEKRWSSMTDLRSART